MQNHGRIGTFCIYIHLLIQNVIQSLISLILYTYFLYTQESFSEAKDCLWKKEEGEGENDENKVPNCFQQHKKNEYSAAEMNLVQGGVQL